MNLVRFMLQMFDGETTETPEPQAKQTQEVAITQEAVDKWLGTEDGKRYLQPKLDAYHTKGMQTHLEKNADKYVSKEDYNKLMTENQEKITGYETQLKQNTIMSKYQKQLLAEGLQADKLDLAIKLSDTSKISLDGDNLLGASDMITGLKTTVSDWFGENKPSLKPSGVGTGGQPVGSGSYTKDQLNNMSDAEYYAALKKE